MATRTCTSTQDRHGTGTARTCTNCATKCATRKECATGRTTSVTATTQDRYELEALAFDTAGVTWPLTLTIDALTLFTPDGGDSISGRRAFSDVREQTVYISLDR